MARYSLLHPLSFISFEAKTHFSTSQDLSLARSKYFKLPQTEIEGTAWDKPPDFSVTQYRSLSVPRNKGRKVKLNLPAPAAPSETGRSAGRSLQGLLGESDERKGLPRFITSFRPPDAQESELMFVKSGKYACECYKNPKAHNFRPLDETLTDTVTKLDVKLKHLDTLCTGNTGSEWSLRKSSVRLDTHKPAAPHWDASLILPPLPWPPKSASYTRHRRRRGAYSAFLERVEEKLSRSWKNRSEQV